MEPFHQKENTSITASRPSSDQDFTSEVREPVMGRADEKAPKGPDKITKRQADDLSADAIDARFKEELFEGEEAMLNFQNIPLLKGDYSLESLLHDDSEKTYDLATEGDAPGLIHKMPLTSLNQSLLSLRERNNFGFFTCMCNSHHVFCFGTTRGNIIVANTNPIQIKHVLSIKEHIAFLGAVTSVALNANHRFLCASYDSGYVLVWDLKKSDYELKVVNLPKDVLYPQTVFSGDDRLGFIVSSNGEGFMFYIMESVLPRKLFEIQPALQPFIHPLVLESPRYDSLFICENLMLATSTNEEVIITTLKPVKKDIMTVKSKSTRPFSLFSWGLPEESAANKKPISFACGFSTSIDVFRGSYEESLSDANFNLAYTVATHNPIYLSWLDESTFYVMEADLKLHVIDTVTGHTKDTRVLQDSLAVTGACSETQLDPGHYYRYTFISHNKSLYAACPDSVVGYGVRTVFEQIQSLSYKGNLLDAMEYICNIINGKVSPNATMPPSEVLLDLFKELVDDYLNKNLYIDVPTNADPRFLAHYAREVLSPVITCCVDLGQQDQLFTQQFLSYILGESYSLVTFIDCLVPFILEGRLSEIPYSFLLLIMDQLSDTGRTVTFESCLLRVDIKGMHIQKLLDFCWNNNLYDGVFYLYVNGFGDYITPLKLLLNRLEISQNKEPNLCNNILKNLCNVLCNQNNHLVFSNVVSFITMKHWPGENIDTKWRYLKIILTYDFKSFINVLMLAFNPIDSITNPSLSQIFRQNRDTLVHTIMQIVFDRHFYQERDIQSFFSFVARQLALSTNALELNKVMLQQIIDHLTVPSEFDAFERQQALLNLFESGALDNFDLDHLTADAVEIKFHLVCEFIYENQKKYDVLLKYMIGQEERKGFLLSTALRLLDKSGNEKRLTHLILNTISELLEDLIRIDHQKVADFIFNHVPSLFKVLERNFKDPTCNYLLLRELFSKKYDDSPYAAILKDHREDQLNCENYITLMCQCEPTNVYDFIVRNSNYRMSIVLSTLSKHNLLLPLSYAYEKTERYEKAAEIFIEINENLLARLRTANLKDFPEDVVFHEFARIFSFLARIRMRIPTDLLESLWARVIGALAGSLDSVDPAFVPVLNSLGDRASSDMLDQVPFMTIVNSIINDSFIIESPFSNIKTVFDLLSKNLNFEGNCCEMLKTMIINECTKRISESHNRRFTGVSMASNVCCNCGFGLYDVGTSATKEDTEVTVFRCSHSCHNSCLPISDGNQTYCPQCAKEPMSSSHKLHNTALQSYEANSALFDRTKRSVEQYSNRIFELYNVSKQEST